eukprot:TRINITY_DN768_c0_g1_i3.p1 TRINITY_DN768_c0_g1~~TRINITY_DN768_c0_g1_i3.p1  ORF type:complete len:240 (-),score=65.20 TRINITY_DN768_c0_g1_i3:249-968(-)
MMTMPDVPGSLGQPYFPGTGSATPSAAVGGQSMGGAVSSSQDSLASLEQSLRETLRRESGDSKRQQKALEIQRQAWDQTRQVLTVPAELTRQAEEPKEAAMKEKEKSLKSKEEEIEKRKQEVEARVRVQVSRVEAEARRLQELRKELESIEDPTRRDVSELRRKIEVVDKELRPLKAICDRKEKELKEAVQLYNEKSQKKTELVGKLFEIVTESEKMRLTKLEELNRYLQAMESRANGH